MSAEIRLLSYNVRSLRDDKDAVAAVIRACRPDVVCIQEAPRFFRWRSKAAWLARASDLVVVTGGRPAGAMLLLASLRLRVISTHDVLLTKRARLHQRGLAMAVFEAGGARFGVASMHLDLVASERERHVPEVIAHVTSLGVPAVVAGDVNEEPGDPAWELLTARFRDAYAVAPDGGEFTSTSIRPRRRIDGVFVDPAIEIVSCGVPDVPGRERATDHMPVLAVLRVS